MIMIIFRAKNQQDSEYKQNTFWTTKYNKLVHIRYHSKKKNATGNVWLNCLHDGWHFQFWLFNENKYEHISGINLDTSFHTASTQTQTS